jgi:predicted RNA-binding Zn-ribbon protein involved in translation (DUF1610 family)
MPTNQHTPRIRQLLRQAERVAELDKRLAARQLYEQILEEAPETAEAWLGLGKLESNPQVKEQALEKAVEYDPANTEAQQLLAKLTGAEPTTPSASEPPNESLILTADVEDDIAEPAPESEPAPELESEPEMETPGHITAGETPKTASPTPSLGKPAGTPKRETSTGTAAPTTEWGPKPEKVVQARFDTAVASPVTPEETATPTDNALACYRHPETETSLRCNRCGNPICIKCANRTSVGYRCPDCLYELEEKYYTGNNIDYLIALGVSAPLSLITGLLLLLVGSFGFSIWLIFFAFPIGGAVGTLLAKLTFRAIGRRRSRHMGTIVTTVVALGSFGPTLLLFVLGLSVGAFNVFGLIMPAAYAFAASSAAYYWLR